MSKKSASNNDHVITGQYLGVVEEFLPDKYSTYVKEGEIFATKTGITKIDERKRKIEVVHKKEEDRKLVKIGDKVIGVILFSRQYSVGIHFYTINNKLHFNSSYFGNIHVSEISNKYVEQIQDVLRITDIIRAKVIGQESNEFKLSTTGKNLGVLHADCIICGTDLEKKGFNKLQCPMCGNIENRKLSEDYGKVSSSLRF